MEHQSHFTRNLRVKFSILNLPQSPDIWSNSDGGISDFPITGRSLIKENCHNSRTRDDIDLKLGPVTKLDKKNKTTWKKIHDDVMSGKSDVIIIVPFHGQFGEIQKPDSGRRVCKTYVFIRSNLLSYKNCKRNSKTSNRALSHNGFE